MNRQWHEKYETEVKQLDEQINATKDVMISLKIKYDDMVDQFNMREMEIQEYVEEKKIKEDAAYAIEREYQSTVKIQSWWKGIMVRRGLGKLVVKLFILLIKIDPSLRTLSSKKRCKEGQKSSRSTQEKIIHQRNRSSTRSHNTLHFNERKKNVYIFFLQKKSIKNCISHD